MHTAKFVTAIVVLIIVIAGSSIYVQSHMSNDAAVLEEAISKIERSVSSGDWQGAKTGLSELDTHWNKTKVIWAMLIDHAEIDNIESTLARMEAAVAQKDVKISLPEAAVLKQYIRHIPARETPGIRNIL